MRESEAAHAEERVVSEIESEHDYTRHPELRMRQDVLRASKGHCRILRRAEL